MKTSKKIMKKILLFFWWQDITKSHWLPRILNYIFVFVLSFGVVSTMVLSSINIIFKVIIGGYLIINIMAFWPTSNLLDEQNKVKGFTFFIFQNNFILISYIILLIYLIKKENFKAM